MDYLIISPSALRPTAFMLWVYISGRQLVSMLQICTKCIIVLEYQVKQSLLIVLFSFISTKEELHKAVSLFTTRLHEDT